MLTCVLNAAEGRLQILLGTEEGILCAQHWQASHSGAEILTPALQNALALLKYTPADITRFACVRGPGSFTGIRLTLSTVAAMRRVTGATNAGIDYMQALALSGQNMLTQKVSLGEGEGADKDEKKSTLFCVLTHARRNLVHVQYFEGATPAPQAVGPVVLQSPAEVLEELVVLSKNSARAYVLGSGYGRNAQTLTSLFQEKNVRQLTCEHPSPEALWQLASLASYHTEDVEPLYVRPCDAVENLSAIAEKQGKDAAAAHATLEALLRAKV